MAGSNVVRPMLPFERNLGLEIVAIHPDSGNLHSRFHPSGCLMQTLRVNGYDMAYLDIGQDTAPPLICVHGSLCDFRIWGAVLGPLTTRHRVIAVSLRHFFPDQWDGL